MGRDAMSPMRRMSRLRQVRLPHLRRLRLSDSRGATLIEFALIAPAFIALLLAIIETSLVFFGQEALETAAELAGRQLMTGQVQQSTTAGVIPLTTVSNNTAAHFKSIACQQLYAFMSCSNLLVDVQTYASFSAVSTATPTITYDASGNATNLQYNTGASGSIVVVRLMYNWSLPSGPLNFTVNDPGSNKKLLIATTVMKTEPYSQS
jgi:Flp pilus assembly protein TadG